MNPNISAISVLGLVVLLFIGFGLWSWMSPAAPGPTSTSTPPVVTVNPIQYKDLIIVDAPLENSIVTSPLEVRGRARGNWYFEASFPARLLDASGQELTAVPAQAEGEWMTTEYVPFKTTLIFSPPTTATGWLVLQKDNPSGLPEHDDEVRIPVRFQ
ncbi:MAG: hypothetical protein A2542_01635 [Parcubacteria group bacterium RIFOXYD2_FULL_52_8]|nr:MAG: hypothetical protein A2542_01635 [Parcubacteria group bacterium RIFOXYD2_FULL_52_8]